MLRLSTEVILVVRGAHIYQNDNSIIIATSLLDRVLLHHLVFFNRCLEINISVLILLNPYLETNLFLNPSGLVQN